MLVHERLCRSSVKKGIYFRRSSQQLLAHVFDALALEPGRIRRRETLLGPSMISCGMYLRMRCAIFACIARLEKILFCLSPVRSR